MLLSALLLAEVGKNVLAKEPLAKPPLLAHSSTSSISDGKVLVSNDPVSRGGRALLLWGLPGTGAGSVAVPVCLA